ncbi:MAG TPA: hypothetical protein PLN85_00820 [archaeon]|nr:hypothetical protein [archaeon]
MLRKDFIRIINETISDFDFLGIGETEKTNNILNKIKNIDFQKQLISDILNRKNNLKFNLEDSSFTENSYDNFYDFSFIYFINLEYNYDSNEKPINLTLDFTGDKINVNLYDDSSKGNYYTPPDYTKYITNINWLDIDVRLFYYGDEIEFNGFHEAPNKIKELFIKEFLENFILTNIGYQYIKF